MIKTGPIVIVDDDHDDLQIFKSVLESLDIKNNILLFDEAEKLLQFMRSGTEKIFFILCDINMPVMDGFELRRLITKDASLASISIPFIFFSTSTASNHISDAYKEPIQGYFVKPSDIESTRSMFRNIISYWSDSEHPF